MYTHTSRVLPVLPPLLPVGSITSLPVHCSLSAGQSLVVWIYYQVNPTNVGHRNQSVVLADGTTPLVRLTRHVTVYP